MLTQTLVAIYFIETGLLLVVAPWTIWWRRNFFAELIPWLPSLMALVVVRWTVVFTGVLTVVAGLTEARAVLSRAIRRPPRPGDQTSV